MESESGEAAALNRVRSALADRYRIERELGAGGMATVYLAEDIKHHRRVAVKVLRPELGATLGPDRFAREIEVAARLLHPHILGLLDSGEAGGFFYYVMPFVEGETLRDRLARTGELPVHEAVRLMIEIAEALAVAHRQGVVHRDIKPENVLLSGRHAMVMDFGVAKAVTEASGRQQLTTAGVALGTPAYMAPEQATADPHLDGRLDVYALGVVGYEMLSGSTPFHGMSPQQTLAAHVTHAPPPLLASRPQLPAALESVIMKCLAKRPADRYQTADELAAALEPFSTPSGGTTPAETRPYASVTGGGPGRVRAVFSVVAVVLVATGAFAIVRSRGAAPPVAITRTSRLTSDPGLEVLPAISPDGKFVAFVREDNASLSAKIFLQPTDGGRALEVTDSLPGNQYSPDWSPDGSRLAFVSEAPAQIGSSIVIMPPTGGAARIIYHGGTQHWAPLAPRWSPDGRHLAFELSDSVLVIDQDGSNLRLVARVDGVNGLSWSPDGRWLAGTRGNAGFLYGQPIGNIAAATIFVVAAAGGTPRMVSDSTTLNISPVWLRDGSGLLYVSSGGGGRDVYEQAIGRDGGAAGPRRRITTGLDAHSISLSYDGRRLAYAKYTRDVNLWTVKIPPAGTADARDATQLTFGNQNIERPRLSADGKWLAYNSDLNGNSDIFVVSVDGGTPRQLTADSADDMNPDWSPDGTQIAFHSMRSGNRDVFTMNVDGTGVQRITSGPEQEWHPVWSSNDALAYNKAYGQRLAVEEVTRTGRGAPWSAPNELVADAGALFGASADRASYVYVDSGVAWQVHTGSHTVTPVMRRGTLPRPLPWVDVRGNPAVLYFATAGSRGYIEAADPIRGTLRKLVTFETLAPDRRISAVATDGRRAYFTLGAHEADIWIAELERR